MAINKKDVEKRVSQEVADAISTAEKIIDKKLENYSGEEIHIDFKDLKIPRPLDDNFINRFKKEIINRYEISGWKVTFNSDQREGSWFVFK